MKTHIATYKDALPIVRYLRKTHATTGWDWVPFDEKRVRNMVVDMIRSQGADVIVAHDEEGRIRGVVLAQTDLFFWSGKTKYATDVHHISTGGGMSCFKRFIKWARDHDCACVITAVATEDERAERLYQRMGFKRKGNALVYRFDTEALTEEEAA